MKSTGGAVTTIDEYIAAFPKAIQRRLSDVRRTIRKAAPRAEEAIKYQMPTFVLHGNLVHFAAFRNHIGLYPTPMGLEPFKKALSAYTGGKGSVQFPHDQPLPLALIGRIVRFRAREVQARQSAKKASAASARKTRKRR